MWVINEEFEKLKEKYQVFKKLYDDETLTVAQHNEIARQLYLIEDKMVNIFTEFYETRWDELLENVEESLRKRYPSVKSFLADIYDTKDWFVLFDAITKASFPKNVDD